MDPNVMWRKSGWAGVVRTAHVWEKAGDRTRTFYTGEPNMRHVWVYYLGTPVEFEEYPLLVMTYRARHNASGYTIWLDDTRGPNTGGVVAFNGGDLVNDGQVHAATKDLRALEPHGHITGMALGVRCDAEGPAEFELIDLRFEATDDSKAGPGLRDGEEVAVKVMDNEGNPVAGARVTVDAERLNFSRSAVTGSDGRVKVTPIANPLDRHMLRVEKDGMTSVEVRDISKVSAGPVLIILRPTVRYSGRVVNEDGGPVAGAVVDFWIDTYRHSNRDAPRTRKPVNVRTDEDGRWKSPPIAADAGQIRLRLIHPDYLSDRWGDHVSKTSMEEIRDGTAVSVMQRGVFVTGTVVDRDGRPVAGAPVTQGADRHGSNTPPATSTDSEGRFTFKDTRSGELVLTARASGHGPALVRLTAVAGLEPVEMKLSQANTVRMRVVDSKGAPMPGVAMSADTWRGYRSIDWHGVSDAEGRAVWKDAPPDPVLYDIYHKGYMSVRNMSMTPREEEYVITLNAQLKVSGSVFDAETGEPLKDFKVTPGIGFDQRSDPHWERRRGKVFSGEYEITFTYPRQRHYVLIEAQGYMPAMSRAFSSDEGQQRLDFRLEKAEAMTGIVRSSDAQLVTGATVAVATAGQGIQIKDGRTLDDRVAAKVTTGSDGRYSFLPQIGKFMIVALADEGYAEAEQEALRESPDITLEPWGRVEGTYMIGKNPGADKEMNIWIQSEYGRGGPNVHHDIKTTTGADGKFVFDRVPPGKGGVSNYMSLGGNRWGGTHTERFEVKPGETVRVDIGGTGRPVTGRFTLPEDFKKAIDWNRGMTSLSTRRDRSEFPKPENWETMEPEEMRKWYEKWTETEAGKAFVKAQENAREKHRRFGFHVARDGSFRIEDVPAGEYTLTAQLHEPLAGRQRGMGELLARVNREVIIPEMPGGRSDEPLEVGTIEVTILKR